MKILAIGDGGCYTGFARVLHSIFDNLDESFEIHHLAVNYKGDPFKVNNPKHYLYPAGLGGDLYGMGRVQSLINKVKPDLIFILNDLWVTQHFLAMMDTKLKKRTVIYFPVDATHSDAEWLVDLPDIGGIVTYTEFARNEILKLNPNLNIQIIPHGVSTDKFYPIDKTEARKVLKVIDKDDFVVFNGNRNQPRKRIDLTMQAFALFSKDKPKNVKLYLHMGVLDEGWNIKKLAARYGIEDRLIITSNSMSPQNGVTDERLNIIYNACNVGINTSLGEGWGLLNTEHAATRTAQIVPNSSACKELFYDCGLLIDIRDEYTLPTIGTVGSVIDVEHTALLLDWAYRNSERLEQVAEIGYKKFTRPEYQWTNIAKQWSSLFKEVLNNDSNVADTKS